VLNKIQNQHVVDAGPHLWFQASKGGDDLTPDEAECLLLLNDLHAAMWSEVSSKDLPRTQAVSSSWGEEEGHCSSTGS
jgi:hypothetical protein